MHSYTLYGNILTGGEKEHKILTKIQDGGLRDLPQIQWIQFVNFSTSFSRNQSPLKEQFGCFN